MDDRNRRYGQRDYYGGRSPRNYSQDYGSGRDYAAGRYDRGHHADRGWRDDARTGWTDEQPDYDRARVTDYYRPAADHGYRGPERHRGYDRGRDQYDADRGFLDRAGDEIRSWFGDEEAERRRERDQRYDAQVGRDERVYGGVGDGQYQSWRRQRIAELDRDYDEYQRENSQRFHNEFSSWRTDRQGQRDSLRRVSEHMEVVGSDGSHVGVVDKIRGDRIVLTKSDSDARGHHHSIPSRWIHSVDDKVTLRKTADEAKAHWRDEEQSGALFGNRDSDRDDWSGERNLNRSFSGTY
ncbi:DUF2171 domain-containing protein [Sphingomonas sp. HF-S4]|uniref:DUF2171 domain-containing protein n=1 Tax=Sphingomonas agrestis TaxID=3080540 RepID=A0ABU3YCL1_9SPHN|nr:DUF2171 domain-containing protein [Sphingomonas sp. HF-S4]MDV3459130.1 DUF2171 domain-containing protein [Sphingomonas sp. HF-S4]